MKQPTYLMQIKGTNDSIAIEGFLPRVGDGVYDGKTTYFIVNVTHVVTIKDEDGVHESITYVVGEAQ